MPSTELSISAPKEKDFSFLIMSKQLLLIHDSFIYLDNNLGMKIGRLILFIKQNRLFIG